METIHVIENAKNSNAAVIKVSRNNLTSLQERAYSFAEKMLVEGTELLKIEARSRLAVNDLCFCDLYYELDN